MKTATSQSEKGEGTDSKQITISNLTDKIIAIDENLEQIPELTLEGLAPWSYSKYKSLKKCPFQFYLKYILKIQVPETLQGESDPLSANVGKAAHSILENVLLGKTVDKSFENTKKEYVVEKKLLTQEQWVEKVETLTYNITRFKERIEAFEIKTPIKRILTELRIGVDRNYQPTGFFSKDVFIRGVIDLVLMLDSLDALIIDHKTGGGQGGVRMYEEQLDWYKFLLHFGIEKVTGAQTGVHFIGEGEIKMANYSPAEDIENTIKNSLEMSLEGAIDMLKEKGYFKHIRGYYCKWCEFDNLGCKSGELLDTEKKTSRWLKTIPIISVPYSKDPYSKDPSA